MLKVGNEVAAVVYRCEDYGVYARSDDGEEIFVTAPELSWSLPANTYDLLGKKINVKILRFSSGNKSWVASARHAHDVPNPYREFLDVPPGTKFRARVTHLFRDGESYVKLDNGTSGILSGHDENLKVGEIIFVKIVRLIQTRSAWIRVWWFREYDLRAAPIHLAHQHTPLK